ncbi:MAG: aquaporin family protein [Cyanobacteria bacterium REEB67]|nr:aquaporin family protein [Cyanobacteria bacterium REEB67]
MTLSRALVAEFLGSAFLLVAVCGSGILAHSLDQGNVALSVLCVAFATGCALVALISMFGALSAHFNPIVTLALALRKEFAWPKVPFYIAVQVLGAVCGVIVANLMFDLPAMTISETGRSTCGLLIGEIVATFGLLGVIFGCGKSRPEAIPFAVPAYVAAAIYFTSSTCFANPAVTIARIFTNTLTGIKPVDVLPFIAAQVVGAVLALVLFGWLYGESSEGEKEDFADNLNENFAPDSLDQARSKAQAIESLEEVYAHSQPV